jgi:hypothetical protein
MIPTDDEHKPKSRMSWKRRGGRYKGLSLPTSVPAGCPWDNMVTIEVSGRGIWRRVLGVSTGLSALSSRPGRSKTDILSQARLSPAVFGPRNITVKCHLHCGSANFPKIWDPSEKFWPVEWWHEACSVLRTHSSGMIFQPCRYFGSFGSVCVCVCVCELVHVFVCKEWNWDNDTDAIIKSLLARAIRRPGFMHPLRMLR